MNHFFEIVANESVREVSFHSSLILCALSSVQKNPLMKKTIKREMNFLKSESSNELTWNYWKRGSADSRRLPCPDDWDDTSVALAAFCLHDSKFLDGARLARIVKNLVASETQPGGPYFTWMLPQSMRKGWDDIDMAVNANIAHFLKIAGIKIPNLEKYFDKLVARNSYQSNYYEPIAIIYFLSKAYRGKEIAKILNYLKRTKNNITKTNLDRARFATAWINLGGNVSEISGDISALKKLRAQDITADNFYVQEISKGKKLWSGSRALTAACVIEAVTCYEKVLAENEKNKAQEKIKLLSEKIHIRVKKRFSDSPREMQNQLGEFIAKLSANDKHFEISLIPYFVFASLKTNSKTRIKKLDVFELCEANLCGWIAYTIYDAIIDGEKKESLLPLANICMREVVLIYKKILDEKDFHVVPRILETIECANFWEHQRCRFKIDALKFEIPKTLPDYKDLNHLAHKSLGHALGPITIIQKIARGKCEAFSARLIEQFFTHYLIAKQLHDDAHDWMADLREGFINPASTLLLKAWKKKFPKRIIFDLSEGSSDVTDSQKMFWDLTIDEICCEVLDQNKKARRVLRKIPELGNTDYLDSLLQSLELSARLGISERDKTKSFLKAYE